jgi:hypothetical protein
MAAVYPLSSYSLATIAVTVASLSATPTYIWTAAVPSGAKGKAGILQMFFNLYVGTNFFAGQTFNYGIYVDGVPLAIGDSATIPYTHTSASPYAISSGGVVRGTNGFQGFNPIIVPVSFSSTASQIQIGITNSSLAMSSVTSVSPHILTNYTSTSGTLNTSNWIPINTFTTTTSYTVPTTVQGGSVQGVFVYLWGAGGGAVSTYAGGPGGYTTGYYACSGGTVLTININVNGGGQAGGSGTGGGYTGVFVTASVIPSNCIAIASGGGGSTSGSQSSGNGGGGGGLTGNLGHIVTGGYSTFTGYAGASGTMVGTQSTFGTNTGGGGPGAQFTGGNGSQHGGGGGAGWYGGAGGNHFYGPGPGCGGSGYIAGLTSSGATTAGTTYTGTTGSASTVVLPPNTSSPYYLTNYGHGAGGGGLAVIVPAIGASANQIGVQANIFAV